MVIHSQLQFDGSTLPPGHCYLGCVVKDNLQKAFFIRVIDPSVRDRKRQREREKKGREGERDYIVVVVDKTFGS